jgi:hypothetical protein
MEEDNVILNPEPTNEKPSLDLNNYEDKMEDAIPDIADPNWTEYVISKLTEDELYDGNPTTDGLRRITPILIGRIIESVPIVLQAPNPQNDNHACVAWRLVIMWADDANDIRTFGDVVDVYSGNTDVEFAVHASSTAATRAEGRALRKALALRHTYVAEEMTKVAPEDPTKITKVQLMFIDKLCQRNDINAIKAILKITKYSKIKNVEDMPYKIAIGVTKAMNDMQNGTLQITDDIMGYDPEWRKVNEG